MNGPTTRGCMLGCLLVLSVTGCAEQAWWEQSKRSLGGDEVLLTTGSLRAIHRVDVSDQSTFGRVLPKTVTCSEPSPDVAKALSTAVSAAASGRAEGLEGVKPEIALEVSRSRAQALAQLTERLATIQLLRDGLYRACEAYANGAISETTYGVLVSRFDDTMVTMLLGELAAGNFGRQLAVLAGGATASGAARLAPGVRQAMEEAQEAAEELETAQAQEDAAEGLLLEAKARAEASAGSPAEAAAKDEQEERETQVQQAETERKVKEARYEAELEALAEAVAEGNGGTARGIAVADLNVASALAAMQEAYLHDLNNDALVVGCLAALDREPFSPDLIPEAIAVSDAHYRLLVAKDELDEAKANAKPGDATVFTLVGQKEETVQSLQATYDERREAWLRRAGDNRTSALAGYCLTGVLPAIVWSRHQILDRLLARGDAEAMLAREASTLKDAASKIHEIGSYVKMLSGEAP